ncbi:hypothetical protein DYGSA30_32610 [Dyella sp. GSA-30]|nr:hypothetical protein DYGSA30_32610 [Dyella sp. GSA-30]
MDGVVYILVAREQRHGLALGLASVHAFDVGLALGIGTKFESQVVKRFNQQAQPLLHHFTTHLQRVGHIGKRQVDGRRDDRQQALHLLLQSIGVASRQYDHGRTMCHPARFGRHNILFDHQMSIRPTGAE